MGYGRVSLPGPLSSLGPPEPGTGATSRIPDDAGRLDGRDQAATSTASPPLVRPVPGTTDNGTHVTFLTSLRRSRPASPTHAAPDQAPQPSPAPGDTTVTATPRRGLRSRPARAAIGATVLALVGGTVAVANAHKTVTLDVDGQVVEVSTFAGSVSGLLAEEGVETGARDVVAPEADAALRSGDEVVVRHARQVTVLADGVETVLWTTALDADEALAALAARGDDVRLVASRSGGTRADLPITLGSGPVDVRVDGRTVSVDGAEDLEDLFAEADVTLSDLDRVHAERSDGRLTVVVQRVVMHEEAVTSAIPFETTVEQTDELYEGTTKTVTAGVPGELAVRFRVIYVDGVEESRREIGQAVTRAPVTAVVREGTRQRPAASSGGGTVNIGGDVWGALAQCESGGNPRAVSSNGLYYGLFQFSLPTWRAMGGSGLPSDASPEEQLQRAQALQARSGWGQWPACAAKLGLL